MYPRKLSYMRCLIIFAIGMALYFCLFILEKKECTPKNNEIHNQTIQEDFLQIQKRVDNKIIELNETRKMIAELVNENILSIDTEEEVGYLESEFTEDPTEMIKMYEINDKYGLLGVDKNTDETIYFEEHNLINDKIESNDKVDLENGEEKEEEEMGEEEVIQATKEYIQDDTVMEIDTLQKLSEMKCKDRDYENSIELKGDFWVMYNFVRANHGPLTCYEDVTFTTHGDYTFLGNLENIVERWNGPVSVAVYGPGEDFSPTIDTIRYLRDCSQAAEHIKNWVTFHIFFHKDHLPLEIPKIDELLEEPYDCVISKPHAVESTYLYRFQSGLYYPANTARNIARESAMTHFVLPADIEMYPTNKLGLRFLNMIAKDVSSLNMTSHQVFSLLPFEVDANTEIPSNKTALKELLKLKQATPLNNNTRPLNNNVPFTQEWLELPETAELSIIGVGKREEKFKNWEPIFICTQSDPLFDERLYWDGKNDRSVLSYTLCLLNYDFLILDDAFLVHRANRKSSELYGERREIAVYEQNLYIHQVIAKELALFYGNKDYCEL